MVEWICLISDLTFGNEAPFVRVHEILDPTTDVD